MSSSGIDISVIIPVYGVEKYIERCLRSLFTQTKTDGVEFILVNDCTKDNSITVAESVIKEFPDLDVIVINHDSNKGLASARNSGIKAAKGAYIQHVDSDDWCEPTMLEELYCKAIECDADIVGCDNYFGETSYVKHKIADNNIDCLKQLVGSNVSNPIWNKLIKSELYFHKGEDFFIPRVDIWEDYLACCKLFYFANKIVYLPKAFLHYNIDNIGSLSRSKFSDFKLNNICMVMAEVEYFIERVGLSERLRDEIIDRHIYGKMTLLNLSNLRQMKMYAKLFPETDKLIFTRKSIAPYRRWALWFALKGMHILAKMLLVAGVKLRKVLKG